MCAVSQLCVFSFFGTHIPHTLYFPNTGNLPDKARYTVSRSPIITDGAVDYVWGVIEKKSDTEYADPALYGGLLIADAVVRQVLTLPTAATQSALRAKTFVRDEFDRPFDTGVPEYSFWCAIKIWMVI